jgi:hypothetical protein
MEGMMTTACVEAQSIFDSLIVGLGVASYDLDAKCEAALRAVGGRAVPYLHAAAAGASPRRRKHIEMLAETISEAQDSSPDVGDLWREALLVAATVHDDRIKAAIIPAIQLWSPAIVDALVQKAIINFGRPAVCLEILQVIERLDDLSQTRTQMEMIMLHSSKSPAVRELAEELSFRMIPRPRAVKADVLA